MHASTTLALFGAGVASLLAVASCGDDSTASDSAVPADAAPADAGDVLCTLPCPAPTANKNTVCGQLVDFETNAPIAAAAPTGRDCLEIPAGERVGPCRLQVRLYDAMGFTQNPTGTPPLSAESLTINDCGRYVAVNVPTPALGFLALAVDDAPGSASDDQALTAVAFPAAPDQRWTRRVGYAVATTTDIAWTTAAGDPLGGATLSEEGVSVSLFLCGGEPVAGVVAPTDGVVDPDNDYYFSDRDPWIRSTIAPAKDATGANGAALLVHAGGVGQADSGSGLPDGCTWRLPSLTKSIPGLVLVSERIAEDGLAGACVCE